MPRQPSSLTLAFGRAVRRLRRAADITQEQLAHLSGLHRTYVSMIERGRGGTPSLEVVEKIAPVLGLAPHQLVKASEDELAEHRRK